MNDKIPLSLSNITVNKDKNIVIHRKQYKSIESEYLSSKYINNFDSDSSDNESTSTLNDWYASDGNSGSDDDISSTDDTDDSTIDDSGSESKNDSGSGDKSRYSGKEDAIVTDLTHTTAGSNTRMRTTGASTSNDYYKSNANSSLVLVLLSVILILVGIIYAFTPTVATIKEYSNRIDTYINNDNSIAHSLIPTHRTFSPINTGATLTSISATNTQYNSVNYDNIITSIKALPNKHSLESSDLVHKFSNNGNRKILIRHDSNLSSSSSLTDYYLGSGRSINVKSKNNTIRIISKIILNIASMAIKTIQKLYRCIYAFIVNY